jgi:hypothetical protein
MDLSGGKKLDSQTVLKRFEFKCFKCRKNLARLTDEKERPLDHTLPISYLWPLTTDNATLLCRVHNAEKSGKWPSEYYSKDELKRLSLLTGISHETLAGPSRYNPEAIERLKNRRHVQELMEKYSPYMDEIIKLRNRLLDDCGFDFFETAQVPQVWVQKADKEHARTHR